MSDNVIQTPGMKEIGAADHRDAVTVNDTAQEITMTAGKHSIELYNNSENDIYYGGSGVTSSKGCLMAPGTTKAFNNVKRGFSLYVICATGLTANMRVVEYD